MSSDDEKIEPADIVESVEEPSPRDILERAVDRLPVEDRARARGALEEMAEKARYAEVIDEMLDAHEIEPADATTSYRVGVTFAALRRGRRRIRGLRADLQIMEAKADDWKRQLQLAEARREELTDAADAVAEVARSLAEADNALDRVRASQKLGRAMVEYSEVREGDE